MSVSSSEHRLEGLEPDNLLAFMALLGMLRALETARPEWKPRASWCLGGGPPRPRLHLAVSNDHEAITAATAEGVQALAADLRFDRKNIDWTPEEACRVQLEAEGGASKAAVLGALFSDAAVNDKKGQVWPTPLCLMFGQGHQFFLPRLSSIPLGELPRELRGARKKIDLTASVCFDEALFHPWKREDRTDGFRWDPEEDRRYSLRARNPSDDSAGMQHGANALAAVAVPVLDGVPVARRSASRFLVRGTSYGEGGSIRLSWPLCTVPMSLEAMRALLVHPDLHDPVRDTKSLTRLGIRAVVHAQRISVGKYFCVSRGNIRWLEGLRV